MIEMKKVFATLRALLDVLEVLVGDSATDELSRQIMEEVTFVITNLLTEYFVLVIFAFISTRDFSNLDMV